MRDGFLFFRPGHPHREIGKPPCAVDTIDQRGIDEGALLGQGRLTVLNVASNPLADQDDQNVLAEPASVRGRRA